MFTKHEILTMGVSSVVSWIGFWFLNFVVDWWYVHAMRFLNLKVEILQYEDEQLGPLWWRLTKDMLFKINGKLYRIRAGLRFDGASIPKPFWWYARPKNNRRNAAPHDQGYQYHFLEMWDETMQQWVKVPAPKHYTDALFHALSIQAEGLTVKTADVLWATVNLAGHKAYHYKTCTQQCATCPRGIQSWCPYMVDFVKS